MEGMKRKKRKAGRNEGSGKVGWKLGKGVQEMKWSEDNEWLKERRNNKGTRRWEGRKEESKELKWI